VDTTSWVTQFISHTITNQEMQQGFQVSSHGIIELLSKTTLQQACNICQYTLCIILKCTTAYM
jgi:hypothetical protein